MKLWLHNFLPFLFSFQLFPFALSQHSPFFFNDWYKYIYIHYVKYMLYICLNTYYIYMNIYIHKYNFFSSYNISRNKKKTKNTLMVNTTPMVKMGHTHTAMKSRGPYPKAYLPPLTSWVSLEQILILIQVNFCFFLISK